MKPLTLTATITLMFIIVVVLTGYKPGENQSAIWDNGISSQQRVSTTAGIGWTNYPKFQKTFLDTDSLVSGDKIVVYNLTERGDTLPNAVRSLSSNLTLDTIEGVTGKHSFEILNDYTHTIRVRALTMTGSRPFVLRRITWQ